MKEKFIALNKQELNRVIYRMATEILEVCNGIDDLILVGIKTRGEGLANRLKKIIDEIECNNILCESIDITLYRDDLGEISESPVIKPIDFKIDISNKRIILVDDVLYTGRTVRAALDALMDLGRPSVVQLAVLIDRGHKQLPVMANYIGKTIATSKKEIVKVKLEEFDNEECVVVVENK